MPTHHISLKSLRSRSVRLSTVFAKAGSMTIKQFCIAVSAVSLFGCDGLGLRRDPPGTGPNGGNVDAKLPGPNEPDAKPGSPDARPTSTPDAQPMMPDAMPEMPLACKDPSTNFGSGAHNPGKACIACHSSSGGPGFTIAGTLYKQAGGALSGATITIVDSANREFNLVTNSNGNFYTSRAMTFPVHAVASRCPSAQEMNGAISNGDCNSSGCHSANGGAGRIKL
jgi:hypothetical protein